MSLIENVQVKFANFDLSISKWEFPDRGVTALVGPSGCGKSTLLRVLMGLEPCPGLKWFVQGEDIGQLPVQERRLGVVFQDSDVFPHLTIRNNLKFAAEARNISDEDLHSRIEHFVKRLNLGGQIDQRAASLSGGQRQRVALGNALIGNPRVLLLDEPFSSLDSDVRAASRFLVKSLVQEAEIPCLLVTHDKEDVAELADEVFYMKDGRLKL